MSLEVQCMQANNDVLVNILFCVPITDVSIISSLHWVLAMLIFQVVNVVNND